MTAISRQFLATQGARIAGPDLSPRIPRAADRAGATCHSRVDEIAPAHTFPRAPTSSQVHEGTGSGRGPSRPEPVNFTVGLSDGVALTLKLAAAASKLAPEEVVRRAIVHYADKLGLDVLSAALDLDDDLAFAVCGRSSAIRHKGDDP